MECICYVSVQRHYYHSISTDYRMLAYSFLCFFIRFEGFKPGFVMNSVMPVNLSRIELHLSLVRSSVTLHLQVKFTSRLPWTETHLRADRSGTLTFWPTTNLSQDTPRSKFTLATSTIILLSSIHLDWVERFQSILLQVKYNLCFMNESLNEGVSRCSNPGLSSCLLHCYMYLPRSQSHDRDDVG